jgi:hypothetical protein
VTGHDQPFDPAAIRHMSWLVFASALHAFS